MKMKFTAAAKTHDKDVLSDPDPQAKTAQSKKRQRVAISSE
jgi:hypothetical protein